MSNKCPKVTIEGVSYPIYFSKQSEALHAAMDYFENKRVTKFTILSFLLSEKAGYRYVVQNHKGQALPIYTGASK